MAAKMDTSGPSPHIRVNLGGEEYRDSKGGNMACG